MPATTPILLAEESPDRGQHRRGQERNRATRNRRINVPLLVVSLAVVGCLLIAGYLIFRYQASRLSLAVKARAEALMEQKEWSRAAEYWQRYLWLAPEDMDARLKLIHAYRQGVVTPGDRRRLSSILYYTIGRAPERDRLKLHLQLAENLLELGDFYGADEEAEKVLLSNENERSANEAASARRIKALALAAVAREDAQVTPEANGADHADEKKVNALANAAPEPVAVSPRKAASALRVALAEFPGDIRLATTLAEFYRFHAEFLNNWASAKPANDDGKPMLANDIADEAMNNLVKAKPDDADARLARYQYRQRHQISDVDHDLEEALRKAPNNYEALLQSAAVAANDDANAARDQLTKAIAISPGDQRGYLALAQLEYSDHRLKEAAAALREGIRKLGPGNIPINLFLAALLIEAKETSEANTVLKQLDDAIQAQLPELSVRARRSLQDQRQLLQARLLIARDKLDGAVAALRMVGPGTENAKAGEATPESLQAKALLAALLGRLGYWDLAASNWAELAARFPQQGEMNRQAAIAFLAAGQPDAAIRQLERYLNPPTIKTGVAWTPTPEAQMLLLQAQLQKQLKLPENRNWSEFTSALKAVKDRLPGRLETVAAEVDYLQSLHTDDAVAATKRLLDDGERQFNNVAKFWSIAALCRQTLGQRTEAESALARFDALEKDPAKRGTLRAIYLARNNDFTQADRVLSELLMAVNAKQARTLQLMRIGILQVSGAADRAKKLVSDLIEASPNDFRFLSTGIDIALQTKDYATAELWEGRLANLNSSDIYSWRAYRARRLLDQYEKLPPQDRAALAQLIVDLRSMRPSWQEAVALSARYADLLGNRKQAIEDYQQAISLGANNPALVERLVALFYADGRYTEAEKYLGRQSTNSATSPELDSLAISAALRRNQSQEAVSLAKSGVERHADDPVRYVWLANVLALDEKTVPEAEQTFQQALKRFPKDTRVWNGLFMLLVRTKQMDKARQLLDELPTKLDESSWERHFIAGQAYQLLGDLPRAQQEYERAVIIQPKDVACRMLLAKLLLSSDVAKATEQFAKVVDLDKTNGEARRQLAVLRAASGSDEDWQRAMQLFESSPHDGVSPDELADNRLRAILLSRRGRNRTERASQVTAARKILEEQVRRRGTAAEDVDCLLLAKTYEQEAWLRNDFSLLQAAREQLENLAERPRAPFSYALEYTDFWSRQVSRSPNRDPEMSRVDWDKLQEEWKNVRPMLVDGAERRIDVLEHEVQQRVDVLKQDPPAQPAEIQAAFTEAMSLVGSRARLQQATGEADDAARAVDEFVKFVTQILPSTESEIGKAQAYLAIGNLYSSLARHGDAETWYRRLREIFPESYVLLVRELAAQQRTMEAITVCLEAAPADQNSPKVAAMLAQLTSLAPQDQEVEKRVAPLISAALKAHSDDVELLQATAVLKVTRNEDDAAIEDFRRVVELAPKNAMALNNLATLLAERPNQRSEALEMVNRALEVSGRQPALLDTLGTIHLRSGDYGQAVASLEEAVAEGGSDARYYFHLAAAYRRVNSLDKAQNSLERAQQLGLGKSILTRGDQQMLQELEQTLRSADELPEHDSRTPTRKLTPASAVGPTRIAQAA